MEWRKSLFVLGLLLACCWGSNVRSFGFNSNCGCRPGPPGPPGPPGRPGYPGYKGWGGGGGGGGGGGFGGGGFFYGGPPFPPPYPPYPYPYPYPQFPIPGNNGNSGNNGTPGNNNFNNNNLDNNVNNDIDININRLLALKRLRQDELINENGGRISSEWNPDVDYQNQEQDENQINGDDPVELDGTANMEVENDYSDDDTSTANSELRAYLVAVR